MTQFSPTRFNILPDIVKNLIIINALVFLAKVVFGEAFGVDLTNKFALYYIGSDNFTPYQVITHMFMHGSLMHIFFNMFALWMFGSALENAWGPKRFLIYYLLTGLGAAALHSFVTWLGIMNLQHAVEAYAASPTINGFMEFISSEVPDGYIGSFNKLLSGWQSDPANIAYVNGSIDLANQLLDIKKNIPTVGASGAVFGILLAFGMIFPNTYIYLYLLFPVKAKYFVLFYGLLELYLGFQNSPGDNVAHFAHLGGMILGFFLIKYWNKSRKNFY